jgi:large subunit ribosomal protein L21
MYAVIRAGGKQYRVAPGDVIRVETVAGTDGAVNFGDVLAVSAGDGQISKPGADVHVTGQIVEQNRSAKILVFHYKRKKQYKKLQGHRQPYTAVRITEIAFGGQKYSAPELPKKKEPKPKKVQAAAAEHAPAGKAPAKKAAVKKTAAKKTAPKKKK